MSILTTMADTLTPERAADSLCELSATFARRFCSMRRGRSRAPEGREASTRASSASWLASSSRRSIAPRATGTRSRPSRWRCRWPAARCSRRAPRAGRSRRCAKRGALSSLMLYDLRAVLGELEGGPPIRRSRSADEGSPRSRQRGVRRARSFRCRSWASEGEAKGSRSRARPGSPRAWRRPMRRMQREREPRVLVYDPDRLRAPGSAGGARARAHHGDRRAAWSADVSGDARVDPRRSRAGRPRARSRARARRRHGRALRRGAARLRALARRRARGAPAGRPRARRMRAGRAGRLDLLRLRGRSGRGGPAARGRLGLRGRARRSPPPCGAQRGRARDPAPRDHPPRRRGGRAQGGPAARLRRAGACRRAPR